MEDSICLQTWLENAYEVSVGDGKFHDKAHEQQLLDVGRVLLELSDDADLEDIVASLKTLPVYGPINYLRESIIECYLAYAVSTFCFERTKYIPGIISMPKDVQDYLMEIIKDNKELYDSSADNDVESEPTFFVENDEMSISFDEKLKSLPSSPIKCSPIDQCMMCFEKTKRITHLQQELSDRNAEEQEKILKLKESFHQQSNNTVNAEMETIELQAQLREKEKQLQDAEKTVTFLESEMLSFKALRVELSDLKDQLEVLRPIADKLDSAEAKNEKLKAKLEDLKDVQAQLKVEYSKHSDTFAALTELQVEAEALRKVKPQLEVYRSQQAELNITVSELKLRLSDKEETVDRLQRANEALSGGQQGNLQQTQHLLEELRVREQQLREVERVGGIGMGMSEMNSDVMQQLQRLQADNSDLREKLDSSALEALETLRKELSDQHCVTATLQKKLLSTKDALQSALVTIDSLRADLRAKTDELTVLTEQFEETRGMYAADTVSLTRRHALHIEHLTKLHEDEVCQMTTSHEGEVCDLTGRLEEATACLNDTQATLSTLQTRAANMESDIAKKEEDLREAADERVRILEESETSLKRMQNEFAELMAQQVSAADEARQQMMSAHQQLLDEMTATHQCELDVEKQRYVSLSADLEEECGKRRKLDRVKKFFEAEAQRLKNQVQVACGAAGAAGAGSMSDIDKAMSELKTMQLQLDDAQAEIILLRSQSVCQSTVTDDVPENSGGDSTQAASASSSSLKGPMRTLRSKTTSCSSSTSAAFNDERDMSSHGMGLKPHISAAAAGVIQGNGIGYTGYLEQAELSEKRIEALTREKRDMLSRSLEENKERMELAQKLLVSEHEVVQLRDGLRKLTLEKERVERRLLKSTESANSVNDENAVNRIEM